MHLYCHIPFCTRKCAFCALYSIRGEAETIAQYPEALYQEYLLQQERWHLPPPQTWYLGGGTPSLLGAEGMEALVRCFSASFSPHSLEEWTVEVNPASAALSFLLALRRIGVTRVSIGAQSFHDKVLSRAGRSHTVSQIRETVKTLQREGLSDVGVDLIAGLPGESETMWRETLRQAVALDLPHLSVYALTIEPKTRLESEIRNGRLPRPDDDVLMDLLAVAEEILVQAGYERYEISNYARPGFRCRQNVGVWEGEDYLGLGPAAASRVGNARWTHKPDFETWRLAIQKKAFPPNESEDLFSERDDRTQRVLFRLRLLEGIPPEVIPPDLEKAWKPVLRRLETQGITTRHVDGAWRLTARGREICEAVMVELLCASE